jgi:hypothetical protein
MKGCDCPPGFSSKASVIKASEPPQSKPLVRSRAFMRATATGSGAPRLRRQANAVARPYAASNNQSAGSAPPDQRP